MQKNSPAARLNPIDRVVSFFSAEAGMRRMAARRAMTITRQYDSAQSSRFSSDWVSPATSGNTELLPALTMLRDRSRDLTRNNALARRAITIRTAFMTGIGIASNSNSGDTARDTKKNAAWKKWAGSTECDARGRHTMNGLYKLIERTREESGECLIRFRYRSLSDGLTIPLQLEVLEPDYLDTSKDGKLDNGNSIVGGIEFNKRGQRVQYHLFGEHPGDTIAVGKWSTKSFPVAADTVIHFYDEERAGQVRGVPMLTAAVLTLRELREYREALLMRAKVEACLSAFITRKEEEGAEIGPSEISNGERYESLSPGMINYLRMGEDVKIVAPSGGGMHSELSSALTLEICAATSVPYHLLSMDTSKENYSTTRAAMMGFKRVIEQEQENVFIPQICQRVWTEFSTVGTNAGLWKAGDDSADYMTPKFEFVDPLKDLQAVILALENNLDSQGNAIMELGYSPDAMLADIARWKAKMKELGIEKAPADQAKPTKKPVI